ncbi:MAG: L-2-hydroxyglutarate oxidase [Candidatus Omnitrophica bacterium]|nr:L-2-hydroxyglutarate oxidase [Candidatus Omnitrophota bacterium]
MPVYDVAVIGGGIVGLATAMEWLTRVPGSRLVVVEKETHLGAHQTGHNSGVIHSGIYYRPGSVKARTCVEGARLLVEFCRAHRSPYLLCGKLVVATEPSELPALETLYQRGCANGVPGLRLLSPEEFREIEPHARGIKALHVPQAGVVDYGEVARAFAEVIRQRGGEIRTSARVQHLERRNGVWVLETAAGDLQATFLVTCGGLQADRVAVMAGASSDVRIVPFRGEYYEVVPERRCLVKGMIYPVPDPALPFLGVHFTRTVDGRVHAGPNAVLALKREGYRKSDVSVTDTWDLVSYSGFWKMAGRYWVTGLGELYRSWSKRAFVRALQRLVPEVRPTDLSPGGSGVRAQAVDPRGALLDDFSIVQGDHAIYVRNVPSPAATASIAIGRRIADMAASAFDEKRLDPLERLR